MCSRTAGIYCRRFPTGGENAAAVHSVDTKIPTGGENAAAVQPLDKVPAGGKTAAAVPPGDKVCGGLFKYA